MSSTNSNYLEVKKRLNVFSKRFYINSLLQNGALYLAVSMILILAVSAIEYFVASGQLIRTALFYFLVTSLIAGLIYFVALPTLRTIGYLRSFSDIQMSKRVGALDVKIKDKLLNVLLLENMQSSSKEMIEAAIDQKAKELSGIPFHLSVKFKKGLVFLRNAGLVLVILLITGMTFPDVFNYGTKRIIYYDQDIKAPPPFNFELLSPLEAVKNESFEIRVEVHGNILPANVQIELQEGTYDTKRIDQNTFSYALKSLKDNISFRFSTPEVLSENYELKVLKRPSIKAFELYVEYPKYIKKENQSMLNVGNITIPEGSRIKWLTSVEDGSELKLNFQENNYNLVIEGGSVSFDSVFYNSANYRFYANNANGLKSDSIQYRISVIHDQFPSIELGEKFDSLLNKSVIIGRISDDYGISGFRFVYKTNDKETYSSENIYFPKGSESSDFIYEIDWSVWSLNKGDEVSYYFEVADNDGIHGAKKTQSQKFNYGLPDEKEMAKQSEEIKDKLETNFEEVIKEAKDLRKDIEQLQKEMIDEKKVDWSSKNKIQELMKKNEKLKNRMDMMNSENLKRNKLENELNKNEDLVRKREELAKLMKEVLDDELLEKLKELEAMMDKLTKEQLQEKMDEIKLENDQLENELDRSLELFRQLEFEKNLDELVTELDELIEKQEDLINETENKKGENLEEDQKKLKEEFENWEKKNEALSEMNDKLENKQDMKDQGEKSEEVKEEMEKASEELSKGKNKKAGGSQKSAKSKMQEMKDDLSAMQSAMQEQAQEDLQSLRNTLENLIELSFEQEEILEGMKGMRLDDPRFTEVTRSQRSVLDGLEVVEDSLNALGKRIVQLEPLINKEVLQAEMNIEKSIKAMTERKQGQVSRHQQLTMTSMNNLAVLLDEVISQIQDQMMQSSGQCSKPGNSKPSQSSMKKMQEQLNKQLDEMKKMMEDGKLPGDKPGNKQEAESLAKMAAEQAKIREELRKMAEGADQKESKELQKLGELMEETEKDIVNREISRETLLRQEKILTRLLEAENAEREQDMEERREAITGFEKKKGNLLNSEEYYKARHDNHEELIKQNIGFNRYFSDKVEEYYKSIAQ